jgi:hypothetical protein
VVHSHLSVARTEIDAFTSDGVASHIVTANGRADDALLGLPPTLTPLAPDDLTVINDSISSYRNTLEKYLQESYSPAEGEGCC